MQQAFGSKVRTRLSSSSKSVSCSCMAAKMVWKAETRLLKMMARHCLRSVLLKPPAFIIRICFRTVDLPLSPAPVVVLVCARPKTNGMRTEQQQLHLALLALLVIADALLDILIAATVRVRGFLAEAHYSWGHEQTRGAGAESRGCRGRKRVAAGL